MTRKRRVFGASFKAKIALAAVRGERTTAQLAGEYGVHAGQVAAWKRQLWAIDITYIPLRHGFLYLTAVLDWYSRYVLAWRLSNTMDGSVCLEALDESLAVARPEIINSDQGSQFTAAVFTGRLEKCGVAISMDGRGRALDNVYVERLWRSVKYEEVYLRDYADCWEAERSLRSYFEFYCRRRIHQALGYRTPAEVYFGAGECDENRRARSL